MFECISEMVNYHDSRRTLFTISEFVLILVLVEICGKKIVVYFLWL